MGRRAAGRPKPWYETFFGPDYLKQYEHTTTGMEVDGIEKVLHLRRGSRVLDLACGAGRHSIELAKRGMDVVGYDLSEPLLKVARAAARKASVRVTFARGDIRDLPYQGEFDAVVNLFTSFGYFDRSEDDRKVLAQVARALKPRGKFLMERFNRESLVPTLPHQSWQVREDRSVILYEDTFDVLRGRYETRQIVIDRSGMREHHASVRAYTFPELKELFDAAGLFVHRVLGGLDLTPYTTRSRRIVLYAVKGLEPEGLRTVW
ncbi:MAG TPA: methyltransferase domain-containing protein [Thermoplasmata archaeon]|nr:methyltransferase domain-containing protein [Thermoplasmata archaeon]